MISSPSAMGSEMPSTCTLSRAVFSPGMRRPRSRPAAIAMPIHTGRNRSSSESFPTTAGGTCVATGVFISSAAGVAGDWVPGVGNRAFIGVSRAGAEGVRVGEDGIDLPLLAGGSGHPHLVLGGEAAGRPQFLVGEQSLVGQACNLGMYRVARLHLHSEVVDGAALARILKQDQLQWRLDDGEIRVTRLDLGGRGVEQLR